MNDEENNASEPGEEALDWHRAADLLAERLTRLRDRCGEALTVSWDACRLPHPSENFCRAMVEEWRIAMNAFWNDLPRLLTKLNQALNCRPGQARRIEIESACQHIAGALEPLASLSERWRDTRLIRRWRLVFSELAETNLFILAQVCALPQKIRGSVADRPSGSGAVNISLKLIPPPNFPPSRATVRALAQAEPPIIRRRERAYEEGILSIAFKFVFASFFLWPWFLIAFLLLWPLFALVAIIWVWLMLLGAAAAVVAKFNPAPRTIATLEILAVATSLVLLLVFIVWAGLRIDHPLVQ